MIQEEKILINVLNHVEERLLRGWTQGCFARLANGTPTHPFNSKATAWCLMGALDVVLLKTRQYAWSSFLCNLLNNVSPRKSFVGYNDLPTTTREDVIALVRRARERILLETINDAKRKEDTD